MPHKISTLFTAFRYTQAFQSISWHSNTFVNSKSWSRTQFVRRSTLTLIIHCMNSELHPSIRTHVRICIVAFVFLLAEWRWMVRFEHTADEKKEEEEGEINRIELSRAKESGRSGRFKTIWMDFNSGLVPHNKAQLLCLIMQIFIKKMLLRLLVISRYSVNVTVLTVGPVFEHRWKTFTEIIT